MTHACIPFFALTDVGQVAHPTACLGTLVEPVCRGGRPGLPLTIGSPGLPLYLPYIYILPIKTVRGRLPFRVLPFSFCSLRKAHFHSRLPVFLIPPPCKAHSHFHSRLSRVFLILPPTKLILIPTCIPRLAKIKLKIQAPRGFEPVTPQVNVLVATATPHVCLCLHL